MSDNKLFRLNKNLKKNLPSNNLNLYEDKENRTPTLQDTKPLSNVHALTIPQPNRIINANNITPTCFVPSITRDKSHSEPCPKVLRNITNTHNREKDEDIGKLLSSIAGHEDQEIIEKTVILTSVHASPVKKKSKAGPIRISDDLEGCKQAIQALKLEMNYDEFDRPIELFRCLEMNSKANLYILLS